VRSRPPGRGYLPARRTASSPVVDRRDRDVRRERASSNTFRDGQTVFHKKKLFGMVTPDVLHIKEIPVIFSPAGNLPRPCGVGAVAPATRTRSPSHPAFRYGRSTPSDPARTGIHHPAASRRGPIPSIHPAFQLHEESRGDEGGTNPRGAPPCPRHDSAFAAVDARPPPSPAAPPEGGFPTSGPSHGDSRESAGSRIPDGRLEHPMTRRSG